MRRNRALSRIMNQTMVVVREGEATQDERGHIIPAPEPQRLPVYGVSVQPPQGIASEEARLASSDAVVTRWFLLAPFSDVKLRENDRIQQAEDRVSLPDPDDPYLDLEVDGDPDEWAKTGVDLDHIEGYLKRWKGGN